MKIYAASIMAFSHFHEAAPKEGNAVMHRPAMIPAESIEAAAELCKAKAFEWWPISEMWYAHQAAICSVTDEFYRAALIALEAGIIEENAPIEENVFEFDT